MKIFLSFLLCLYLSLPFAAHAGSQRILATVFPVWLLLQEVTRDVPGVDADLLLPAGTGCPHDYAITPSERRTLAGADVLVMNGLGMESFLGPQEKLPELMKPGAAVVDCSKGLHHLLGEIQTHGDHAQNAPHHGANPHLFASPSMAAHMVQNMADQLSALLPAQSESLQANAMLAKKRLEALAQECSKLHLDGRRVVAQHSVFDYLARDCGLTVIAHIQSHEGQEPSARNMLDLLKLIRREQADAVLVEPQYPARAGQTLADETGIPCLSLDPAAHGPKHATLDYYENIMRANLHALERHLAHR